MKILFSGAQGTGKTTLFNELKKLPEFSEYKFIESVSRKVQEECKVDLKGGKCTNIEFQDKIFREYLNQFNSTDNIVADRSLYDVLAYTEHIEGLMHNSDIVQNQLFDIFEFEGNNRENLVYVYFPIEFEIEDDGTRSIDRDFQKSIDCIIYYSLKSSSLFNTVVTVRGSVQERLDILLNSLKSI